MTAEQLEQLQSMVALHLSVHRPIDLTWWEWTGLMQARMQSLSSYYGDRPSSELALLFAADAVALLGAVLESENADPASGLEAA
jgi:hypothetical protein